MVEKLALKIHLAFAMIGLVGGIAGFVAFVFAFHNFHAGKQKTRQFTRQDSFVLTNLLFRNLESNLRSNGNVLSTYALHQFEGTIRNELHQRSPEIHWTFRTFHDNYQPFR